jgi:hypothetical protein
MVCAFHYAVRLSTSTFISTLLPVQQVLKLTIGSTEQLPVSPEDSERQGPKGREAGNYSLWSYQADCGTDSLRFINLTLLTSIECFLHKYIKCHGPIIPYLVYQLELAARTMAIYEDIRSDTLNKRGLATYLKNDPNILNGLDSADGYTPLIAAAVNGKAEIVQLLLKQGARVDAPSRDGETPLLLVARKASYNHARVIQLLLSAKPPPSIDAPDSAGKTPLMFAIQNKDIESIRLLSRAGASQTVTDANGVGVKELAKQTGDVAVLRALNPAEPSILAKVTNVVVTFVLTILAWINGKTGGIIGKLFGFNPEASKLDITVSVCPSFVPDTQQPPVSSAIVEREQGKPRSDPRPVHSERRPVCQ